jgi:hypothetical protein
MVIKWYRLWAFLHFVPKRNDVISASTELIGLSNSVHSKNVDPQVIHERKDKIAKALGFKIQTP